MIRQPLFLPLRSCARLLAIAVTFGLAAAQRTQLQSFDVPVVSGTASIQSGRLLLNFTPWTASTPVVNTLELRVRSRDGWEFLSAPPVAPHLDPIDLWTGSVDMQGEWIVLGAKRFEFLQGSSQGTVQLMRIDASGSVVSEQRIDSLDPEPTSFGQSVSLDGSMLAVGANGRDDPPFPNAGEVLLYELSNGVWTLHQILQPSPGTVTATSYQFGKHVLLDGDRLFVSANNLWVGAVHVFERDAAGQYVETQILIEPNAASSEQFGADIDVSGDLLVCGKARGSGRTGRAVLYRHDPALGQWLRIEEFRSHIPTILVGVGDEFGRSVDIDDGIVVVGDGQTPSSGSTYGALFVFRPNPDGTYPTIASEVLRATEGFADGLGLGELDYENGIVSSMAGFGGSGQIGTVFTFSVGPERDVFGIANGLSTTGYYLDTFIDEYAGPAPGGGVRRGLILSGAPQGTRYLIIGAFQGDRTGSGALFGLPGLCLVPPFVRVSFGTVGGENELSITVANDLSPMSDRFLTVGGTVFLQGLCAPPAGMGTINWTNGIELTVN